MPGGNRRGLLWSDPRVKPPFGAELDLGHALCRDLTSHLLFNEGAGNPSPGPFPDPTNPFWGLGDLRTWTLTGPVWGNSHKGSALLFDNTDKYLTEDSSKYQFGPTSASQTVFTVEMLVIPDLVNAAIHALFSSATGALRGYLWSSNVFAAYDATSLDLLGTTTAVAGTPYSVGIVYDGTTRFIYVNGIAENSAAQNRAWSEGQIKIGSDDFSQHWSGAIVHWRRWNRGLPADEMFQLAAEPYAMYRPIIPRRYFVSAAGTPPLRTLMGVGR